MLAVRPGTGSSGRFRRLAAVHLYGPAAMAAGPFVSWRILCWENPSYLVSAFLWPLPLLEFSPPWGIAILVAIYLVFANFIKKPLEHWLFHDDD